MKAESKRTVLRVEVTPEFKSELLKFCANYGEKYSTVARIALREFIAKHESPAEILSAESQMNDLELETWERLKRIKDSVARNSTNYRADD
ncbi:MAG: hypothetical protein ACPGES_02490 [Coraliomargarita sp.]